MLKLNIYLSDSVYIEPSKSDILHHVLKRLIRSVGQYWSSLNVPTTSDIVQWTSSAVPKLDEDGETENNEDLLAAQESGIIADDYS